METWTILATSFENENVIGATFDEFASKLVVFLGQARDEESYDNVRVVLLSKDMSSFKDGYQFSEDEVVYGFETLENKLEIMAFGSALWLSKDGGNFFSRLFIPDTFNFVSLKTSRYAFTLQDSGGSLFFGRPGSSEIAPLPYSVMDSAHFISALGSVNVFRVNESASHLEYVPIVSSLPFIDISMPNTGLVFVPLSGTSSRFYARNGSFTDQIKNWEIRQAPNGGTAWISDVHGTFVDCVIMETFIPERRGLVQKSPIEGDGVTEQLHISDTGSSNASIVLVLETSSWYLQDIGKTIILGGGSFLIVGVLNSTAVACEIFQYPASNYKYSDITWELYDFGKAVELIQNLNQAASISAVNSNGQQDVGIGPFAVADCE
ncbi:MAG: hypothetical protein SGCHY_001510 [Lobulomycetales sp.]